MLRSRDRLESSIFSLSETLLRLARTQAEQLVRDGGRSASVQELEFMPKFLITRDESDVILLQTLEIDGENFFLGVQKMDI